MSHCLFSEGDKDRNVAGETYHESEKIVHPSLAGGTSAAEAMASQLHNNYRLQQMASEGYELSAKSIGGRRTPAVNNSPKVPSNQSDESVIKP